MAGVPCPADGGCWGPPAEGAVPGAIGGMGIPRLGGLPCGGQEQAGGEGPLCRAGGNGDPVPGAGVPAP